MTPFILASCLYFLRSSIFAFLNCSARSARFWKRPSDTPSPAHSFQPLATLGASTLPPSSWSIWASFSYSKASMASVSSWVIKRLRRVWSSFDMDITFFYSVLNDWRSADTSNVTSMGAVVDFFCLASGLRMDLGFSSYIMEASEATGACSFWAAFLMSSSSGFFRVGTLKA